MITISQKIILEKSLKSNISSNSLITKNVHRYKLTDKNELMDNCFIAK